MDIDTFIEATNAATDQATVLGLYQDAVAAFGFDRMMYAALQAHPLSQDICVVGTYPEDWITHYVEHGYKDLDPLRRYGGLNRAPFSWDDLARRHRYGAVERRVMHEAREAGLNDGVAVPLHGPGGELMGVSLACQDANPDGPRFLPQVHILTVQFHMAYGALAPGAASPRRAVLTPREREVLQWAARGKSNWVIGEILNISEHGVDYHLRNILRKLDADSRITAVVKGLTQGLIAL